MVTLPSAATKRKRLLIWLVIPLFSGLLIAFLVILYPKKSFIHTLMYPIHPSEVSINYLKNLIEEYPKDLSLKLALADQEIRVGKISEAKDLIQPYLSLKPKNSYEWKVLWMYYQIVRIETFALPEGNLQRERKMDILAKLSTTLLEAPNMTSDKAGQMAEESLGLGQTDNAARFYRMAIPKNKSLQQLNRPASFYAQAARAMLYVKDYQNSANYFLMAMQQSKGRLEKRSYFIKAVESLEAEGSAAKAYAFAEKHVDGMNKDPQVLKYLTQLALGANKTEKVRVYMGQLLQLQYSEKPNDDAQRR